MMFKRLCDINFLFSAWKIVKSKNSAGGIDGFSLIDFEENLQKNLTDLLIELKGKTWNPEPYLKVEIRKNETEKRKLGLLSIKDKIVQQALKMLIEPRLEKHFLRNSYGYRPGLGHTKAVRRSLHELRIKKNGWVAQLDIDNYFDTINHDLLFSRLKGLINDDEILRLVELSVKMGIVSKKFKWSEIKEGVPQGAVLSPLLANLYLHPFDQFVLTRTQSYIRYSDDFIMLTESREEMDKLVEQATQFLQKRLLLKLNAPLICQKEQGIEFLGVIISPQGINISDKKKEKLKGRIESISFEQGSISEKSLETLSGINRYYAQLLPQEILITLDEMLKSRITTAIGQAIDTISDKNTLIQSLKKISFFAEQTTLEKRNLINQWVESYSLIKKGKTTEKRGRDKNKTLIESKKREYQKKEGEGAELVVSSYGSFIGKTKSGISVRVNGKIVHKKPSRALEHITITTRGVSISSDAIEYCMENQIPIDFFDNTGKLYASVFSPISVASGLWQKQMSMPISKRAYLASRIVYGKLRNQLNLVKYYHKYHKIVEELDQQYQQTVHVLSELCDGLKNYSSTEERYREELMAFEARGAIYYWAYIRRLLMDDGVEFETREHQGAKDLFNCMLNYGYAILYPRILRTILRMKLNPMVGVLHTYQDKKPTFSYDIIEIFRAQAVDRALIGLVQKSQYLKLDKNNRLDPETKKLLIKSILERINRYEKYRNREMKFLSIIKEQTREIAAYINEEAKTFRPYVAKW